jgi:hypothetical protein
MANIENSRLLLKRSVTAGVVPTVPITNNLNDFIATDIFEGELFYNVADGILYSRDLTGITILGSSGSSQNLSATLAIGNTTGNNNIELTTDWAIYNDASSSPRESFIRLGRSTDTSEITIQTSDTGTSDTARIILTQDAATPGLNTVYQSAQDLVNGILVESRIASDAIQFQNLFVQDTTNSKEISVIISPYLGQRTTQQDDITNNRQAILVEQPVSRDFSINDLTSGTSLVDEANIITNLGWNRTTTGATFSTGIEQYFDGRVRIDAGLSFEVNTPLINLPQLPAYADDVAAGASGLATGDLYQTDGTGVLTTPGIVMIKQ